MRLYNKGRVTSTSIYKSKLFYLEVTTLCAVFRKFLYNITFSKKNHASEPTTLCLNFLNFFNLHTSFRSDQLRSHFRTTINDVHPVASDIECSLRIYVTRSNLTKLFAVCTNSLSSGSI